jgi:uncharacterized membrane protein YgdD (TMEM256/DUF423 family)
MMTRAWLAAAGIGGFLSVATSAVAAHIAIGDRTTELLRTGALYGIVHAAALLGVTIMAETRTRPALALIIAGCGFAAGLMLFILRLFTLAMTGFKSLGLITPLGGVGLLVGWAALGAHALHRR